jgi:hypothetical protein
LAAAKAAARSDNARSSATIDKKEAADAASFFCAQVHPVAAFATGTNLGSGLFWTMQPFRTAMEL